MKIEDVVVRHAPRDVFGGRLQRDDLPLLSNLINVLCRLFCFCWITELVVVVLVVVVVVVV